MFKTYMDSVKNYIGWDASISDNEALKRIPSTITTLLDKGIKTILIKKKSYHQIEIIAEKKDIELVAKKISKEIGIQTFYTDYIEKTHHNILGIFICEPTFKKYFIIYGYWDKHSDIFFPKYNIKSDIEKSAIFGILNIQLPTDPQTLISRLNDMSYDLCNKNIPTKELKIEILNRLIFASFNYPTAMIWQSKNIPLEIFGDVKNTIDIQGSPSVINYLSNADIANLIRKNIPKEIFIPMMPTCKEEVKLDIQNTENIKKEAKNVIESIMQLGSKFGIYQEHSEKLIKFFDSLLKSKKETQQSDINNFLASTIPFIKSGSLSLRVDMNKKVVLEYTQNNI